MPRGIICLMSENIKKLLLIILTGSCFGSSVVFARIALEEIGPFPITSLRFGIAGLLYMLTLPFLKQQLPKTARKYRDVALVGAGIGLPFLLFYSALTYLSSGMFSIFFATLPILTALIAHMALQNERLNRRLVIGLTVSLIGIVFLVATKTNGLAGHVFDIRGPIIALVGVLMVAVATAYARANLNDEHPYMVSSLQTLAAFIIVTLVVLLSGKLHIGSISFNGWFAIFYNAIVGSYIPFWLTFILIKKYGATAGALPSYVMPVVSGLLGAALIGEVISVTLLFGAAIVITGLYLATRNHPAT